MCVCVSIDVLFSCCVAVVTSWHSYCAVMYCVRAEARVVCVVLCVLCVVCGVCCVCCALCVLCVVWVVYCTGRQVLCYMPRHVTQRNVHIYYTVKYQCAFDVHASLTIMRHSPMRHSNASLQCATLMRHSNVSLQCATPMRHSNAPL